jgi:hypothetical protein
MAHGEPIAGCRAPLKVSQERVSFFLPISKETRGRVPLMPDQDYNGYRIRSGAPIKLATASKLLFAGDINGR